MEDILRINTTDDGRIEFTCPDRDRAVIAMVDGIAERLMAHQDQSALDILFAVNVHLCAMVGDKFTDEYIGNLRKFAKEYRGAIMKNAN